jgi:hypothetical protein
MQEQVLVASRLKIALQALAAAALLAASIFVVIWGDRASDTQMLTYGVLFTFLLGVGLIAILVTLARPGRLMIGKDALLIKGSFRQRRVAWSDVQEFAVKKGKSSLITIRYGMPQPAKGRGAGRASEATFPVADFSMPSSAIAQLLNQALHDAVDGRLPPRAAEADEQPQIVS